MPLRRRNQTGYRGVRARPNGTFTAEIRSGDDRISLGSFETADAAARAWDAAAWRLERPRSQLNFPGVRNAQEAANRAPPPRLVTEDDRRGHRLLEERDRCAVADWYSRNPSAVAAEEAYWASRAAERRERRAERREEREQRREESRQRREERRQRRERKAWAEEDLAAGRATWPEGHPLWNALADNVPDDTDTDGDDDNSSSSDDSSV